ncbi:hypothetical protein [Microcystis phage MJing1]|nr:hypothetical protein [Microcystis phage MJing1]
MARTIEYEWCAEETDEHGDVGSLFFGGTRAEVEAYKPDAGKVMRIVLVRYVVVDGDRTDTTWAYVGADGKLPERFSTSFDLAYGRPASDARVPQRFFKKGV